MSPADGGDIGGARLVGGASSDADAMAARAARIAERLDASAAARRAVNEVRREAVQNQASEAESVSGFLSTLNADRAQAEADIQAATTGGRIDELIGTLAALEERVAKAAYFLPNYDVRAAQAALSAARKAADARRTAVAPRKKFAFKKKIHKSSAPIPTQQPAEQSIAADVAADTPLPAIPPGRGEAGGAAGRDVVVTSDGGDYTFAGLRECRVVIRGACTALRLLKCSGCQVFAAPVEGSCFVDACDACVLHVSTRQIRIHSTKVRGMPARTQRQSSAASACEGPIGRLR